MPLRPIFFDLETTGLSPSKDKIIEIGAYDPLGEISFQSFVNPGISVSQVTESICGITNDMLKNAPSLTEACEQFFSFCEGNILLIAHNGESFDFPFLYYELCKVHLKIPVHWKCLDSLKWARKYRKDLPRHSLQYLRHIFGIPENKAHRALDDAMTLHAIFSLLVDDLSGEEIMERGDGMLLSALLKPLETLEQPSSLERELF